MAHLRIAEAAERQGMKLNQLYQALNTARAQRGKPFAALGTVRRYWHSTEDGSVNGTELDQISWSFLQEVAGVLGVSVYDLLPVEDGLGNTMPVPRRTLENVA
jgi:hypothetical protein